MAGDFQAFHCVGRLTNDPQRYDFGGGGAVVNFGLAFTGNVRNNPQTGRREEEPCFIDCKAFINQQGRGVGDVFMRYTSKGARVFIAGRLVLDKWEDNNRNKRQAIRLVVERMTLLESRQDRGNDDGAGGTNSGSWDDGGGYGDEYGGGQGGGRQYGGGQQNRGNQQQNRGGAPSGGGGWDDSAPPAGSDDDIPF